MSDASERPRGRWSKALLIVAGCLVMLALAALVGYWMLQLVRAG